MRILHLASTLDPRAGGPPRVIVDLIKHQALAGQDVSVATVFAHSDAETEKAELAWENANLQIPLHKFPTTFEPMAYSAELMRWLVGNVSAFNVIHIHGLYRFPTTFGAYCARRAGVPYVVSPHGALDPFVRSRSRKSIVLKKLYERVFERRTLEFASVIHYGSTEERARAATLRLRSPTAVVPHGVSAEWFVRRESTGRLRSQLGLSEESQIVLFVGRMSLVKGLEELVAGLRACIRAIPSAVLLLVGPDDEGYGVVLRQCISRLDLTSRVIMMGYMDPDRIRELYSEAAVVVLPSYSESFGMAIVEAMASGKAVVVSDQVGVASLISRRGAGLVVEPKASKIADALVRIMGCSEMASRLGEAARELCSTEFRWEQVVEQINGIYIATVRTPSPIL